MAEASPEEGFLQRQLECSVCLNTYDLKDRVPMGLYCMHTLCKSCVDTLSKTPPVKCPKCKRSTDVEALRRNFSLCDVLEKLCQACFSREMVASCDHCHNNLCSVCLDVHAEIFEGDVKQNMDQLRAEVKASAEKTIDETVLEQEKKHATDTIDRIEGKIAELQKEIRKLEAELKTKVTELRKLNIQEHRAWQKKLATEVEKCKTFLDTSEDRLRSYSQIKCPTKALAEINNETLKLLEVLQHVQTCTPHPVKYMYVGLDTTPEVGEILSNPSTAEDVGPVSSKTYYTRARFIAMSGSKDSEPEEFWLDCYVASTNDRYIVADTYNHRIKIYDKDLKIVQIFGDQGSQRDQFNFPREVLVIPTGELYVSDSSNNRIKVYDTEYQLVRCFGSKGSGKDGLNKPRGLAFTSTGELLVADSENFRVKVLRPDGTYIRTFGSRDQFQNVPVSVAVTSNCHVLLNERWSSRLLKFTLAGEYPQVITLSVPNARELIETIGFVVDKNGNIIITDKDNHQLIVLNEEEQFVCVVGREGDQPGELHRPISVSVSGNRLLVYEAGNGRIQLFET